MKITKCDCIQGLRGGAICSDCEGTTFRQFDEQAKAEPKAETIVEKVKKVIKKKK